MVRLRKKLVVLSDEQTILDEESISNEQLGSTVAINVSMKNSPADTSKCRSYVDDIGYITMLLLSISGRLASIENVLNKSEDADPEVVKTNMLIHPFNKKLIFFDF